VIFGLNFPAFLIKIAHFFFFLVLNALILIEEAKACYWPSFKLQGWLKFDLFNWVIGFFTVVV